MEERGDIMDFNIKELLVSEGFIKNPFSSKKDGEWTEGVTSIYFLNENFSQYETAKEMVSATESEGLKLFFSWLKEQGVLN